MSEKSILPFGTIRNIVKKSADSIDVDDLKSKASQLGEVVSDRAGAIKTTAMETKEDIDNKIHELDRQLEQAVTDYNDAYTQMNDKGMKLYVERCRATDSIEFVENLINSIANRPKSFDTDFETINNNRKKFTQACDFADREIQEARKAATGAGAGLAAGATVAFMAPSAAMWIATTFGTASTGAAISTLSGAAATNAALAWLGGGALTAGGGGMVAGHALLALAGPVGMTIAGATLLSTIVIYSKNKKELNRQKSEEIASVKNNTISVLKTDTQIAAILDQTSSVRMGLNNSYRDCTKMFNRDYLSFSREEKRQLGALVNNTKTLSALFEKTVE